MALDSANPAVYKQLYRAAKAKLKLRLKATTVEPQKAKELLASDTPSESAKRNTYLETVLSHPTLMSGPVADISFLRTAIDRVAMATALPPDASRSTIPTMKDAPTTGFSIDCNNCGITVVDEHYHCSQCEMGDFDLCPHCIEGGVSCHEDNHWLIKRTIKNGRVYTSSTETVEVKVKAEPVVVDVPTVTSFVEEQRTCNSCIIREYSLPSHATCSLTSTELKAADFVTCEQCTDYDLCFDCVQSGEHGHHPMHTFAPVDPTSAEFTPYIKTVCQGGHGLKHDAICDGCDATIIGVRHKCLSCPDFDLCSSCVKSAPEIHPVHRFARIYEHLGLVKTEKKVHRGIYCDGPVCSQKARPSYIRGIRYKCAICDDTDLCADCEALPHATHNPTHPLIKIKIPIRHVSVTAIEEPSYGAGPFYAGDHQASPVFQHASTETTRPSSANAATQVQTVAEVTPAEAPQSRAHDIASNNAVQSNLVLQAWFECDSTPDGSTFAPNRTLTQSWTLRNPGPETWPAGCAVYFIGGDDMRHLDDKHPFSMEKMTKANRSNVLTEPLEPGKTAVFSVLLKSPARDGRAISYWRLKTEEGLPFGHKLWCDINVAEQTKTPVFTPLVVPVETTAEVAAQPKKDVSLVETEQSQASSIMVFPKLDKESPASSIYAAKREIEVEPSVAASEEQDLLDDIDSMALEDELTDDGFMTDEEYDILEAEN